MADFPHLRLPFKVEGAAIFPPGGKRDKAAAAITNQNKKNRQGHGQLLLSSAETAIEKWEGRKARLKDDGIVLPNENDVPIFLKVDTDAFDIDTFRLHWGIELVSEEEGGYIIGASVDSLEAFEKNIDDFINENGIRKHKAAQIWEFVTDDDWRIEKLLHPDLAERWPEISEEAIYTIQLGVSCYAPPPKEYPNRSRFDSEAKFQEKVAEFDELDEQQQIERDEKQRKREDEIEKYVEIYEGELLNIWSNDEDAVFFKISINGRGLKDIVHTYQYLFEARFDAQYELSKPYLSEEDSFETQILAPAENTAAVCVIDSGIQENHFLLEPAIDAANSRSYVDGDATTADYVKQSGHGTKVAGAILYPIQIPKAGQFQLESFIQNARILDKNGRIAPSKFEPKLMEEIVADYRETRIFNLSVGEGYAYSGTHMPALAASIDKLTHENDILFVVSAGNLSNTSTWLRNLGIREHIQGGRNYPEYLNRPGSKINNPGVSYFAITVGSIAHEDFEDEDYKALAGKDNVSPFSRTGLGMWGCIKPDVVEFGGDLAKNKLSDEIITNGSIAPELVNSTLHGASSVGRDDCGTSFSAPKVSYIASRLQTEHPNETAQMYRALIVQSARLPNHCFQHPTLNDFRYYGYGVPDVDRALNNSESRITFIQNGNVEPKNADIYRVKVPDEFRGEGKNFQILVEITLAFTARTRLTRKGSHSYLSNWLEWRSSRYNEGFQSFRNRTIEYLEIDEEIVEAGGIDEGADAIKWVLRENPAWADNGINRNNSTVQKSWALIEPHRLNDDFSIAVVGHAGWDKNLESATSYALCVAFEVVGAELNIYDLFAKAQVEVDSEIEVEA